VKGLNIVHPRGVGVLIGVRLSLWEEPWGKKRFPPPIGPDK